MVENNTDYIFGRLENERKYIDKQNKRINDAKLQSQKSWLEQAIETIAKTLGESVKTIIHFFAQLFRAIFG